jgi:YesN/AraC family two-component response regulator
MEAAKKFLVETDKPIGEISGQVGYLNYSSFYKTFIETVGMSPQDYRMKHVTQYEWNAQLL